jgi:hypothetical protein
MASLVIPGISIAQREFSDKIPHPFDGDVNAADYLVVYQHWLYCSTGFHRYLK